MSVVLLGSTSGSVTLQEPAIAGNTVLSLPAVSGTVLTTTSPKAGNVIQVVQATKTDTATTTSTSFSDVAGLSVSITPTSSTSKILVFLNLGGIGNTSNAVLFNLVRGSTNIAQPDSGSAPATINVYPGITVAIWNSSITWLDSPSTTSSTTYKVQWRVDAGTGYLNRHTSQTNYNSVSTITLMEIAA